MIHPYFFRFMMEIVLHGFLRRRPAMIEIARGCIWVARVLRYYASVRGTMILRPLPGIQVRPGYQDMESKTGLLKILFFIQANMMQDPVHFSKYIVNEWSHHILYIVHNYFSESPGPANSSTSSNINDIFEETERDRERKTNSGT